MLNIISQPGYRQNVIEMFPWQQKQYGAVTFKSRPLFISFAYVLIPGDNRAIEERAGLHSAAGFLYSLSALYIKSTSNLSAALSSSQKNWGPLITFLSTVSFPI